MIGMREMTTAGMKALWEQGQNDDGWPIVPCTFSDFQRTVAEYQSAELFEHGAFKCLTYDEQTCGFVIFNVLPEHLTGHAAQIVECGTYLTPKFRGKGLHADIKRLTIDYAIHTFDAEYTVFVVPESNQRAIRAIAKLPWDFHVSSENIVGPFEKLRKRKAWETGTRVVVYALHREAFDSHTP